MNRLNLSPGDAVVSDFGLYEHWSIVSPLTCSKGLPMLISASKRTGTVQEEEWDKVTQGAKTRVVSIAPNLDRNAVIARARSQVGTWRYSVLKSNCEHFAKWSLGMPIKSEQVAGAIALGGVGAALALCEENPRLGMGLALVSLFAAGGVMLAKASVKREVGALSV